MIAKFKLIIFYCFCLLSGEQINNIRMSIIPEYEENFTTILLNVDRINLDLKNDFSMTLPDDIDSVYLIDKIEENSLNFKSISYKKTKIEKKITLPFTSTTSLMMITKKYNKTGKRYFNYKLSFSDKISILDIELREPLIGENFSYSGFNGELEIDNFGQRSYRKVKENINKSEVNIISLTYINKMGTTTITKLDSINNSESLKNKDKKQKIVRYKIYVWETLIVLFLICSLVMIISFNSKNKQIVKKCHKCGEKLNFNDLFCSKCGEKLNVSNNI